VFPYKWQSKLIVSCCCRSCYIFLQWKEQKYLQGLAVLSDWDWPGGTFLVRVHCLWIQPEQQERRPKVLYAFDKDSDDNCDSDGDGDDDDDDDIDDVFMHAFKMTVYYIAHFQYSRSATIYKKKWIIVMIFFYCLGACSPVHGRLTKITKVGYLMMVIAMMWGWHY